MARKRSRSWPNGSSPAWRRVRRRVLDRDGQRCQLRMAGCTTIATHVHHTRDRAEVGDDPRYLLAACSPCNHRAGSPAGKATRPGADPPPRPLAWW